MVGKCEIRGFGFHELHINQGQIDRKKRVPGSMNVTRVAILVLRTA